MPTIQDALLPVAKAMAQYTFPFMSGIYGVESEDRGALLGSGTVLDLYGQPYLLTAAHVVEQGRKFQKIAHSKGDAAHPSLVQHPWQCVGFPSDLAMSRLDQQGIAGHRIRPLPAALIGKDASNLDGDILFVHGWPGKRSVPVFEIAQGIASKTLPYATVVGVSKAGWFDPQIHFAVDYRFEGQIGEHGREEVPPPPDGLSGSAVWRTNWLGRCHQWRPQDAQIVGVAFGWDQSGSSLVVTRVEAVRRFINYCLRQEAAYFHWRNRGRPLGDDWNDWFAVADKMI
jgi:hypothetical protein